MWHDLPALAVATALLIRFGGRLSSLTKLPAITVYLVTGTLCSTIGLVSASASRELSLLHQSTLAIITFAAGSELELDAIRLNARLVSSISACLTISALACVSTLHALLTSFWLPAESPPLADGGDGDDASIKRTRRHVSSMLAGVVAIARSPSSAIGVVTEVEADGPFTQCMLTVTMVTDVIVVVLFLAAAEIAEAVLSPDAAGLLHAASHFVGRTVVHLGLSVAHGALLCCLCLLALRLPRSPAPLRPLALLGVGGLAFSAEGMLRGTLRGYPTLNGLVRLEPMMSCILAGCALVNGCGKRRAFGELLTRVLPPVLCFFFLTTGVAMDVRALWQTWPLACALFGARLLSLRVGYAAGAALATRSDAPNAPPPPALRAPASLAWLAFITQAGVGLGLAEEIGDRFAPWAEGLRTALVASIVLNQLVGPPLLKLALRASGEAGQSQKRDKLVEQLSHRLTKENPKALETISDAAMAIASALATAATVTAADAAKTAAATAASELDQLAARGWINLQRGSETPRTPARIDGAAAEPWQPESTAPKAE
jgi:Kef-type K+ transport system membrane component KefB